VPLAGRVITVDALHTTGDTARGIVETHRADRLMTVKTNAEETFGMPGTIDRERDATGAFDEEPVRGHGRIECRRIRTMTPPPGVTDHPHVARILRVERELARPDPDGDRKPSYACGVTSVPEDRGTPERLLEWNRGHRMIENPTTGCGTSTSARTPARAARYLPPPTARSATTSRSSSGEAPTSPG